VVSYSRLPETFGSIALGALKNGKPFVGFSGNAAGEIVESDRQGYLAKDPAEFEKYIDKLIIDDGLRILFSRNALERAKEFDSSDYYEKIVSVFKYVIEADKKLTARELIARMES
jgi:glycosyltransferase involved in cell wall biosynthesis